MDKIAILTFRRSELLYDINNLAFVEADIMKSEDEHGRHQVYDICEDGNVDYVTRAMDKAFAECVELCYPYSKVAVNAVEGTEAGDLPVTTGTTTAARVDGDKLVMEKNDVKGVTEEYVLRLRLPDDFSQTTLNVLTRYIHDFMVYRVLADWMSITNAGSTADWAGKAQSLEEQIPIKLNSRCGRIRRKMHPW